MASEDLQAERVYSLTLIAKGIMFGMAFIVIIAFLFAMHLQMDRIERNQLNDDAYRSTVQALEVE